MSSEELKMRDKSMLWSIDLLSIAVLVSRFPPRLYPAAPWERQTEESLIRRIHFDHFDLNGKSLHHRHQQFQAIVQDVFMNFHDDSMMFLCFFSFTLRATCVLSTSDSFKFNVEHTRFERPACSTVHISLSLCAGRCASCVETKMYTL